MIWRGCQAGLKSLCRKGLWGRSARPQLTLNVAGLGASGTLFGRFKLSPGGPADPELRFDFSGDFKNTRNQTFALETSDGARGAIELIPGPAFNLLEVNFQTEARAGKIRQGNFVLVKK